MNRRGAVLIVVLVVVALLTFSALTFARLMIAERRAVDLAGQQAQARALAQSGIELARIYLTKNDDERFDEGGHYDNPLLFQGRLVRDDTTPGLRGRVSLLSPALNDQGRYEGIRFGLEDESTRLNLSLLLVADENQENGGRQLLSVLPGMTDEIADAILDWIDDDDGGEEVRELGAESEYYLSLDPPYKPRNAPPISVEELLLVRGVTPQLLFGLDVDRNGLVDANEAGGELDESANVDNAEGTLDRGWSAFLTTHSLESNLNDMGEPKVFLNQEDMAILFAEIEAVSFREWATFIVAYRQNGPYTGTKQGDRAGSGALDLTRPGRFPIPQVIDLIGKRVQVTYENDDEPTVLDSPFPEGPIAMRVYLPKMMEALTVNPSLTIPGRISINQASRTVLLGIPEMDEQLVDQIISFRDADQTGNEPIRRHETWLLAEALVTLDQMKALTPFITGGGDVFRTQVVGYFEDGSATARGEAIIDASRAFPRLRFWRDLSHLGRGFSVDTLGIGAADAAVE